MNSITSRFNAARKQAFSLAEMLLVLLILSFLTVALAPIAYKKVPKKTDRGTHGRFECYYEGDKLMQYTASELTGPEEPIEVDKCTFNPPVKATFFIVQAIGGGAGGAYITGSPTATTPIYETGNILAPSSGTSYSATNCAITDSGSTGNKGDAEATCPDWISSIWAANNPSVTLTACASGGDGGMGLAQHVDSETNTTQRSTGGDGGQGSCTSFPVVTPLDIPFAYSGSIYHGSGNITLTYPNGSCVLGGGTQGGDAPTYVDDGSDGSTNSSTCSLSASKTSGGAGRKGLMSNEAGYGLRSAGDYGSFRLTNVSYKRQGTKAATRYGFMGNTGEYLSLFFPGMTQSLDITVGNGGNAGASVANPKGGDGGDTLLKFKDTTDAEALKAKGGKGKELGGSYNFWLKGGEPIDKGAVNASARFATASGFSTFIELDEQTKTPSKITGTMTGMGGDGAYSIVRNTTSTELFSLNGVNITNKSYAAENQGKAYNCVDKRGNVLKTLTGGEVICPAQKGSSGAVVIVW